uniref:Protein translocase subunit SecY n=1 Tax=Candidatus Phytoplasma noviguineense TaxID=1617948 RepID=A0A286P930_9MOLU|nr:protein translocase subunit SecY [Candidatus Phytoplasma noviguineense]
MKKIINFFFNKKNIIKKFFFTLVIIFLYVLGTQIYIPFLSESKYEKLIFNKQITVLFGFLGENFNTLCLLSLGIMPYITASIVMQFVRKIFVSIKEWEEQGEKGKYKINVATRILTLFFALTQGLALIINSKVFNFQTDEMFAIIQTLFFLVVGVFICIWLADLITAKGIGNGISLLIVVNISKEVFNTFQFLLFGQIVLLKRLFILLLFIILLILTVILSSSYLKIPIYYASNKNNDKIERNIPIKVNTSGVLPIILASTLLNIFPIINIFFNKNNRIHQFTTFFIESRQNLGLGFFIYLLLIALFACFSAFMTISPNEIAQHLSKQDAYLENIKPGPQTVYKITQEVFKVTVLGTIFLTLLAATPDIIGYFFEIQRNIKFGGTGLLIIVGVGVEFIQCINAKTNLKQMYDKLF